MFSIPYITPVGEIMTILSPFYINMQINHVVIYIFDPYTSNITCTIITWNSNHVKCCKYTCKYTLWTLNYFFYFIYQLTTVIEIQYNTRCCYMNSVLFYIKYINLAYMYIYIFKVKRSEKKILKNAYYPPQITLFKNF